MLNPVNKAAIAVACVLSLSLPTISEAQPLRPKEQAQAKVEDFKPDPTKRLTEAQFVKGVKRLHEYLVQAVDKAKDEDKKFLLLEKAEIERQLKDPKAALAAQFKSVEQQIARLDQIKVFTKPLVAKMRMHYLETEAGKAVGVLINEKKKPMVSNHVQAEIQYQLGIIAQRDQVNYKTALRHFDKAAQLSPGNVDYMTTLADLHVLLGHKGDAVKIYKELIGVMTKLKAPEAQLALVRKKIAGAM